jgi:hypothetical protein
MNEVVCSYATLRKKCIMRISVRCFCSESNWYVICKKKNQTQAVGADGNI